MSYGLRFDDDFFDVDEHKWKLRIYKRDYVEDAENNTLTLGNDPVHITYEQSGDDFFAPLIGSTCKIQMYVTEDSGGAFWDTESDNWESANFSWEETNFDFVQPIDDREYKVQVLYAHSGGSATSTSANKLVDSSANFYADASVGDCVYNLTDGGFANVTAIDSTTQITIDSNIFTSGEEYLVYKKYWTGFIIQDQYTLPMKAFPFMLEFYASDLLGTIDGYQYEGTTERPSAIEVIRECLKNINEQNGSADVGSALQFDYRTLCRIKPNTSASNGDPFLQTFIRSREAMFDENDIAVDCKTILESILAMYNCRMFQRGETWTIISNDALGLSSFSGTGKTFTKYAYNNVSVSAGSETVSSVTQNINSSESEDSIQPLNNDLLKILKRPCVTTRTNIRIGDMLFNEITNGNFESVSSASGSTPSWGRNIDNWTVTGGASTSSTVYAVNSSAVDTSVWPVIVYGIEPASGVYSVLSVGNQGSSSAFSTEILKNTTGNTGNISGNLTFKFSSFANDPDRSASDPLLTSIRYQFKVGVNYWDNANQTWTSSATAGRNTIVGTVAEEWIENTVIMSQPPAAGDLEIILYLSGEDAYENANFRMYFDNFIVVPETENETFSTKVVLTKSPYNDNSGVLKTTDVRFGQLSDLIYANTLVNTSGTVISSYTHFDTSIISTNMNLETMMNVLRLNDLAVSNDRFEGTFRKVNKTSIQPSGNRINKAKPIDLLTKPKLAFTSVGLDNELAIDYMSFNVAKNRFKLRTHTPKNITSETPINNNGDIRFNRNFYKFKPE